MALVILGHPVFILCPFIPSNPILSYLLSSPPLSLIIIFSSPIITAIFRQRVGVITLLPRKWMIKYHYKQPLRIQFFACASGIKTVLGTFRLCGHLCGLDRLLLADSLSAHTASHHLLHPLAVKMIHMGL